MNGKGNKMIKRLSAILIACVLFCNTLSAMATSKYYNYRDLPVVTADDLVYKSVNIAELEKNIATIKELIAENDNTEKVTELTLDSFCFYSDVSRAYTLATLAYDRNCSEENLANINEASEKMLDVSKLLSELIYFLCDNEEYSGALELLFGDKETALYFALPDDDELADLLDAEMELATRYNEVFSDPDASAELFIELIEVRNKIAKKFGYENYAEYAKKEIYLRECSDEEIAEFYDAVLEHFLPLNGKTMLAFILSVSDSIPMSEDDVLLNARAIVRKINPELANAYEYLIANNIFDIRFSETKNKAAGAYTAIIPQLNVPYIFINPEVDFELDGVFTVSTLLHEFGHFSSMLNSPEAELGDFTAFLTPNIDVAEIHSQGLEVLGERYYGKVYDASAPMIRYYLMSTILSAAIEGCLYNRWEETVYAMENPTVEDLNLEFCELFIEDYDEYTMREIQEIWTGIPHIYQRPMYYLSYAISSVAVLGLYCDSLVDYDAAVDTYMRISAMGVYRTYSEISEECDLYDIYDPEVIKDMATKLTTALGLGYTDTDEESWYMPYLCFVSNIMDGRTNDKFMPDSAITRSEFVTALGRMYDYYVGMDKEYECNFADVTDDELEKYIGWAQSEGVVDGYDDVTFGVDDALTREQAATILFRLSDVVSDDIDVSVFVDGDAISDWARPATSWAVKREIINGRDGNVFDPKTSITRAETAKIVSMYIISEY